MTMNPTISRRLLLAGMAASLPAVARAGADPLMAAASFRGSLSPGDYGVEPNAVDPAAKAFARMLKDAGGIPAYGNQRTEWDAGCRFDFPNPEYR